MSEEKETSSDDKGSKLKHKLEEMGVMRDEAQQPSEQSHSFWQGKLPVIIVVFLAVVFGWWYTQHKRAEMSSQAQQYSGPPSGATYPPGYNPYGSPPPGWSNSPRTDREEVGSSATASMPPGWRGPANRYDDRYGPPPPNWPNSPRAGGEDTGSTATAPPMPPGWRGPGNRYDDRYGPPPGWRPAYPPPPPVYYGYPYYGPPPNYPYPYYRGYNEPMPPPPSN